mgnify:FL=1
MKKITVNFISILLAGFLYWGLIQYTDTGTIALPELIVTPEPWLLAIFLSIVMVLWKKFKAHKETQKSRG